MADYGSLRQNLLSQQVRLLFSTILLMAAPARQAVDAIEALACLSRLSLVACLALVTCRLSPLEKLLRQRQSIACVDSTKRAHKQLSGKCIAALPSLLEAFGTVQLSVAGHADGSCPDSRSASLVLHESFGCEVELGEP